MTSRATKNVEREIRRFIHSALTEFNAMHKGVPSEIRDPLKAAFVQNLKRWAEWFRAQPEPEQIPRTSDKPLTKRRKSRMIHDNS